jgi:hypothetical protein
MRKYAAATALVIALITMLTLTPAVSAGAGWWPRHEADCDRLPDWGRPYVTRCHCGFECERQYSHTVTLPCSSTDFPYALGRHEGLCDVRVVPFEARRACIATCKAKEAARR